MFICGLCFIYTRPGEKATRVVVETREVEYPFRKDANSFIKCERILGTNKFYPGKPEKSDDPGGKGTEIVKEVLACKVCAEARNQIAI